MNRIAPVKSQEELQADILCLKRQLTLALDENQLLKVKARRLKDELRRKNKHVESLMGDPQKDRQPGRFSHEGGASMLYKLQKRNAELEDMILERDLNDEKRHKDLRTVCLYSPSMDVQARKKGFASSMQSIARLKSCPRSHSPSVNSLSKINTSAKRGRLRSSDSSLQSLKSPRVTNNSYSTNSTDDSHIVRKQCEAKISSVFKTPDLEKILEKRALQMKNAEIARLSAELQEIKNLLRQQESKSLSKSTSTTQIRDGFYQPISVRTNFIEENERGVNHSHMNYIGRKISRTTSDDYSDNESVVEDKKLSTLHEQNEETLSIKSPETSSDVNNKNCQETTSSRPKTRIEYVYDSEVSSDGEEFSLSSNLTSFLQRAVNTLSSRDVTDNNSD